MGGAWYGYNEFDRFLDGANFSIKGGSSRAPISVVAPGLEVLLADSE